MQGSDNLLVRAARKLPAEEQRSLVLAYQSGNTEAGGKLIESQSPWILNRLRKSNLPRSVDYDDVMSELSIVLLRALKRYDHDKAKLSTFVAKIVDRRKDRIVNRLQGRLAKQTVDTTECLDLIAEEKPDDRIEIIMEAIDACDLKEEARYAVQLWAEGLTWDAIDSRVRKRFPSAETKSADSLVDDALRVVRSELVAMGYELPEDAELQRMLW